MHLYLIVLIIIVRSYIDPIVGHTENLGPTNAHRKCITLTINIMNSPTIQALQYNTTQYILEGKPAIIIMWEESMNTKPQIYYNNE